MYVNKAYIKQNIFHNKVVWQRPALEQNAKLWQKGQKGSNRN